MASIGTASVRIDPDMTAVTGSSFRSRMARVGKVAAAALAARSASVKGRAQEHLAAMRSNDVTEDQVLGGLLPAEQTTDADRAEAARLFGLDPGLADRLHGESAAELIRDAAELAGTLDRLRREPAPVVSMDGGARMTAPAEPEGHDAWLSRLLREHRNGGGEW